ncbi:MAG: stage III sporulation protein AF [Oscillospiraceae bacterium]|nr:stage III sporulation protein AF [Oscillospiraceae bacterium]
MTAAVRQWLTSIVMLSFLISLIRILIPEGTLRKAGAFTGSLVLLSAILRPLVRLEPDWPDWDLSAYESAITARMDELNAQQADTFGVQVAEKTAETITAQAARLGVTVSASVTVRVTDGVPCPWSVTLYGTPSEALSAWVSEALDIPPERQFWTTPAP